MFELFGFKKKTAKTKVLVVDDEPKIVQTLQDRLEMNNFQVLAGYDGREGLDLAIEHSPDIILLDIIMPFMDGLEMLEKLRENPQTKNIPVIMLTARSQQSDVARAENCGIEDYIVKPFNITELLEKIELLVEKSKATVI